MNTRVVVPAVAVVVVLVIVLMSSVFTVHQTEKALVKQFGNPVRVITEPGLQFKIPLVQDVSYFDNRILDLEPPQEEVIAADQKRLVVDSYARYRIADPLQFFQLVSTEANANTRLSSIINSALRRVIGNVPLASVVAEKRAAVMQQVRDEVNAQAKSWGMDVIDVRIKRADLPGENSDAIYQRMKTERQREAAQFRGEGKREAQKIHANADRQVVEIRALAQQQAEILRGEGDSESIRIYADAFNRDKDFFALYWSLEAYRRSLANGDTTFVLSPDSEFFRFFGSASGVPEAQIQSQAPKP
ncbi:MAG TPA: protease modulator HflC [Stellaceae bacterium]|jgi:membrane protease subunit HflC|nr:protease modulator HflC [Stellaceae bacterium]